MHPSTIHVKDEDDNIEHRHTGESLHMIYSHMVICFFISAVAAAPLLQSTQLLVPLNSSDASRPRSIFADAVHRVQHLRGDVALYIYLSASDPNIDFQSHRVHGRNIHSDMDAYLQPRRFSG